ncbi:MAG: PD-(D/E)XK nuclease family protein, partial [Anaerolineae bacterium]
METLIRKHLPEIVRSDPSFRQWVLEVAAEQFADKAETDSRFERLLAELREERRSHQAEWKEYQAQMERRWEEHRAEW